MAAMKCTFILALLLVPVVMTHAADAAQVTTKPTPVIWNLKAKFGGITHSGIVLAIAEAKAHFAKNPNDTIVIEFDAGTYFLAAPENHVNKDKGDKGIIELSGLKPGPEGRLVFLGAGMDKTTLIFDPASHQISGRDVHRVTFKGLHMTRKDYTVSQGHVVTVAPGRIDLDIQNGFPTPQDIFNTKIDQGRYLRRYTDDKTNPQLILENNDQIAWKSAEHIADRRWRLHLKKSTELANYKPGDLIGIKSKNGGQTYWLSGGSDFVFEDMKWTQVSRGVFRGGFDKIRFTRCIVDRAPAINGQVPCLSTPDGGPQIGQPNDPPTSGNLVEDCRMTATGDDSIAFFNASGIIRNCRITDCFARGILLYKSPNAKGENNTMIRSIIARKNGTSADGKGVSSLHKKETIELPRAASKAISYQFDMLSRECLQGCEIHLCDLHPGRLKKVSDYVKRAVEKHKLPAKIFAEADRTKALPGADFVITSISVGGAANWGEPYKSEIEIPRKYGIEQSVADTVSVGAVFRFLRTGPVQQQIIKDVERYAPSALVLNHTKNKSNDNKKSMGK